MIGGNATSLLAVDLLGVPIADEATPIQARRLAQDDRVGAENWITSATVRMYASPAAVVLTHHATDFGS